MTKQFLNAPQISSTLEQMRRSRVTQPVRTDVVGAFDVRNKRVDDGTHLTLIGPAAAAAEQQRGPTALTREGWAALLEPGPDCSGGRHSERDHALLAPLAEHPDTAAVEVDVVDVQTHQLADADATGVEKLERGAVSQVHRVAVVGCDLGHRKQRPGLGLAEHAWQRGVAAR